MDENKLARKVKKAATVNLLLSLPLLALAGLFIWLLSASGMLSGDGFIKPYTVNALSAIDRIAKLPLGTDANTVRLTAPYGNVVDTGIYRKEDNATIGDYLAVYMGDKYVFCYLDEKTYKALTWEGDVTLTGTLHEIKDKTVTLAVEQMGKENISESDARAMIYGYYVDTTDNGVFPRIFVYILTLVFLFFGLWVLLRNMAAVANPLRHPQVKKLARYGDVAEIFEQIDREYSEKADESLKLGAGRGSIFLGPQWVVVMAGFGGLGIKFMRAESLLWAYKLKRTTKAYGVVTTGVTYTLMLRGADKSLALLGAEFDVDGALAAISTRYPWTVLGYSASLEAAWRSNREQFTTYAREHGAPSSL